MKLKCHSRKHSLNAKESSKAGIEGGGKDMRHMEN